MDAVAEAQRARVLAIQYQLVRLVKLAWVTIRGIQLHEDL